MDIWDTKITQDGEHYVWYSRKVNPQELVENGDRFRIGKHNIVMIEAYPFKWYEVLYYRTRDILDWLKDRKIFGKYGRYH